MPGAWLKRLSGPSAPRHRLVCLPYAGGAARIFRGWPARLPQDVEVLAAEPPGHGTRIAEPPIADMRALVAPLAGELSPDREYVLYGHSMGALVAYELGRELRRRHGTGPTALLVSGRDAPELPAPPPHLHDLPDAELTEALERFGGTPASVLQTPDLMELFLPVIRADLTVAETYRPTAEPPLGCPVRVYSGGSDPLVTDAGLDAWRAESDGDFRLRRFDGDHFFLAAREDALLNAIADDLRSVRSANGGGN
ncbi:MAG TPA: alpha/beta fold hydrolase [Streptosporangiaceae bacterium]|jgi:surfactin synthase thioesterase subunit